MEHGSNHASRNAGPILVVDDDPLQRREIVRCLRDEGIETCEAGDGEEAIAVLSKESPTLIIMDICMPVLDGVAAAKKMMAGASGQSKIILVTGDPDSLSRADEMGPVLAAVVEKPINLRVLMAEVSRALGSVTDTPA